MLNKKFIFLLLILTPLTSLASQRSLSQEIDKTKDIVETLDLIAAYHDIAQQIENRDSNRIAKKLFKLIKNLHTICCDEEDVRTQFAYKNLLQTALSNPKLAAIDYANELSDLLDHYLNTISPDAIQISLSDEEIDATEADTIVTNLIEGEQSPPKPERIEKLYENVQNIDRENIAPKLYLRKLINDVTKITRNFQIMQNEIALLKEQGNMLALIYKKLIAIEKSIKQNDISENMTRFPIIGESQQDEYQEYSPLLQKLIAMD